ncbi:hypothetical protein C4K10_1436 [Pseudomonas chlororaphis subsp. aureofaciens]|nr:hypothetical protein C4K10_1436 [Pseudomonas chlororaphis subsp. aureofaciens]AZE15868.1 hypothetical protein C4K09_1390 [Pseudomonas chlororaphis subsp. aureofaciens]
MQGFAASFQKRQKAGVNSHISHMPSFAKRELKKSTKI